MMGDEARQLGRSTMLKASSKQESLDFFVRAMESYFNGF